MDVSSFIITFDSFHTERVNARQAIFQSSLVRFAQVHFSTNHCIEKGLTEVVERR